MPYTALFISGEIVFQEYVALAALQHKMIVIWSRSYSEQILIEELKVIGRWGFSLSIE